MQSQTAKNAQPTKFTRKSLSKATLLRCQESHQFPQKLSRKSEARTANSSLAHELTPHPPYPAMPTAGPHPQAVQVRLTYFRGVVESFFLSQFDELVFFCYKCVLSSLFF